MAKPMHRVTPLRHIGHQTTAEVLIAEFRDLAEKCKSQPILDVAAQSSHSRENRHFKEQQREYEKQNSDHGSNTVDNHA